MTTENFYVGMSLMQAQMILDTQVMIIWGLLMLSMIAFLIGAGLMLRRNKAVITDTTVVLE